MKELITAILVLFIPVCSFAQGSSLTVTIDNIQINEGSIMIALHASDETFPNDEPVKTLKVDVTANQAIGTFENLTQGEYAISLFHDENSNGELDKNLMGIPKEPFGFSNDEMGMFGPPSFNKCVIVVSPNEDIQTTITLKSM